MTVLPDGFTQLRPSQADALSQTVRHFQNGAEVVVVDAPTGVGKSLLAEMVRRELSTSAIYLCSNLSLQDQFAGMFPQAVDLRGRRNFPTLNHPDKFPRLSAEDCDKAEGMCSWCSDIQDCPYERKKLEALRAELACMNLHYWLREVNGPGRFGHNSGLVILDECDLVEDTLMSTVEVSISNRMQRELGLDKPAKKTVLASWIEWFAESIPRVEKWLRDHDEPTKQRVAVERLYGRMVDVARQLADGGWIYDYAPNDPTIRFRPVSVAPLGQEWLWGHGRRFLLMSATVISPEVLMRELGGEGLNWEAVRAGSEFDADRCQVRIWPVAPMGRKWKEESWPKMVEGLKAVLVEHPNERVLVLTNSYALSQYLYERVGGERLYTYLSAGERDRAIREFEQDGQGVLLASSLERGYDGTDDLVRVVVVAKVPWPDLSSKQVTARLYSSGGQEWYQVLTLRKIVQGCGRGMRHAEDWMVAYVLDADGKRVLDGRWVPEWFGERVRWGGQWKKRLEG